MLQLDDREAHHARHVLRLRAGDEVVVLDGMGNQYFCAVDTASGGTLTLRLRRKMSQAPAPCSITLLVAIPKGKIIEDIIEKAVELGARRIVPLLTERVVTRLDEKDAEQKRDKWQQVAIEAIKQCGAVWLPSLETPTTIDRFLARKEPLDLALVGSLQTERQHPKTIFRKYEQQHGRSPATAGVWIGPEGDFTLEELKAIEAAGAAPITLGDLTLRVETAAIYCLSIVNYELNCSLKSR